MIWIIQQIKKVYEIFLANHWMEYYIKNKVRDNALNRMNPFAEQKPKTIVNAVTFLFDGWEFPRRGRDLKIGVGFSSGSVF